MGLPQTYLMSAPEGCQNPFGETILSDDFVRGMRCINPAIRAWEQNSSDLWYPGKGRISCLWIGDPGGKSKKLCAFPLGPIPEFTQIAPDNEVLLLGWRAIFSDIIKTGGATRERIERQFKISLNHDEKDSACRQCRMYGTVRPSDKDGLCRAHWDIREITKRKRGLTGR